MTPYIAITLHNCFNCTHADVSPIYDYSGRMLKTMHTIDEAHQPSATFEKVPALARQHCGAFGLEINKLLCRLLAIEELRKCEC